tara:strand:+ start:318 stop:626 length:309 start_codon:yes stop_codon:yes gene_type:complete
VEAAAVLEAAQQRCPMQGVLLVDRVVIYSPDQEALLVTAFQALAGAVVVLAVTAHTTAMTVVALLMGQAAGAAGARRGAATAYLLLAMLAARELNPTAIVLH